MTMLEQLDLPPLRTLEVRGAAGDAALSVDVWLKSGADEHRILDVLNLDAYGWPWALMTTGPTWEPLAGADFKYQLCRGVKVVADVDVEVRIYTPTAVTL